MDKSPDAFRTISEVAIDLDLPQHVLRFWETRFVQIRPLKRGGGRRYYRPDDVDLLKGIRHLLYGEGYTIRGVQRILKEQGVRFVMNVWRDGAPQPPAGARAQGGAQSHEEPAVDDDAGYAYADDPADEPAELPPDDAYSPYAPHHLTPASVPRAADAADFAVPMVGDDAPDLREEPRFTGSSLGEEAAGAAELAQRFAPRFAPSDATEDDGRAETPRPSPISRATPRPLAETRPVPPIEPPRPPPESAVAVERSGGVRPPPGIETKEAGRPGLGQFLDRLRPGTARDADGPTVRSTQSLSRDEIRRLQSTLFELLECKRLLDQVR